MYRVQSQVAAPAGRLVVGELGRRHGVVCGGGKERCASRSSCARIFSTAAGAIFQIWGLKITFFFFFFSPFNATLGTTLGGVLAQYGIEGCMLG